MPDPAANSVPDAREARVDEAIAEYLRGKPAGSFDVSGWLARYPDAAAELADFLRDEGVFNEFVSPFRAAAAGDSTRSHRGGAADSTATAGGPAGPDAPAPAGFDDFEVEREVARGGMGVVYRARQKSLNRVVALKMVLGGSFASRREAERLYREAEAAAGLDHPHIVPVYAVGEHDGRPFFVMKLVEGGSLAERSAALRGRFREVAGLVAAVARAVHHAHVRGVLHRDLKPSNILVDGAGEPHVTDFGLSRKLDPGPGASASGAVAGTPSYMAPEQARGEKGLTTAVDVYGLGGVLYHLLTGAAPFQAESTAETLLLVLRADPERPRAVRPDVPRDLEVICLKCLEKDPARRYPSAEAVADDLERWLAGEPIQARPASPAERAAKWVRRNPAAATVAGVVALAVAAVIVSLVVSNRLVTQALGEKTSALGEAEAKKTEAENALGRERAALGEKDAALRDKTKVADELAALLKKEQRTAYQRGLMVAERDLRDNRLEAARRMLDGLGPAEVRGWEWDYLRRQCDPTPVRGIPGWPIEVLPVPNSTPPRADVAWVRRVEGGRGVELVIGGEDGGVRRRFPFPFDYTADATVSPDGKRVAIARAVAQHHDKGPKGEKLSTISHEFAVEVFDTPTGEMLGAVPKVGPANSVRIAFHPAGDRLAGTVSYNVPNNAGGITAGARGEVRLWTVPSGDLLRILPDVRGYAFSPDGKWFIASLVVFETDTGKEVFRLPGSSLILTFRPDGKHLAALDRDGLLTIWDTATWKPAARFAGHPGGSLAYSPDGARLAVGREDGTVRVIRADDAKELRVIRTTLGTNTTGWLRFHPDGEHVFGSAGRHGFPASDRNPMAIDVWPVGKPQDVVVVEKVGQGFYGPTACWDPAGRWVASAASNWDIKLWDPATGAVLRTLTGPKNSVFDVAVSPNGRYLAAGAHDGAWVWDLRGTGPARRIQVPKNTWSEYWVGRVTFSPDSSRLVLTFTNGLVIHDVATGRHEYTIVDEEGMWFADAAYSPDGSRLLTTRRPGNSGSPLAVRDPKTGKALTEWDGDHGQANTVRWFKDGNRFVATGSDGHVRLWDSSGKLLHTFSGHTHGVNGVSVSPDQTRLATAGQDATVKVWDVVNGVELLTLTGHRGEVYAVAFSPDGRRIASTGSDRTLRVWDATRTAAMRYHGAALEKVRALFAEALLKEDVVRLLREDKTLSDDFRGVALKLAETLEENAHKLNEASWAVVSKPGQPAEAYARALRQAEAAVRHQPYTDEYQNTLGWACYRAGDFARAVQVLTVRRRAGGKPKEPTDPADLAPLAMARHRLGRPEAQDTLRRLREAMKKPERANDEELLGFLREAEALIQDPQK